MNEEYEFWKKSYDELESLKRALQKGLEQWQSIHAEWVQLYDRADRDPEAARAVRNIEAYFRAKRDSGEDLQQRVEELKANMKRMELRLEQDRRARGQESAAMQADNEVPVVKKRIRPFA
jgi:predicted  nucleic acid-binding Zn-ribbon protein